MTVTNTTPLSGSAAALSDDISGQLANLFQSAMQKQGSSSSQPTPDKTSMPSDTSHQSVSQFSDGSLGAAESLSKNWDNWDMHKGADFANPPSNASQEQKDTFKFINDNTTLYNAMISGNGGDPAKDPLTKADVDKYISDTKSDGSDAGAPIDAWNSVSGLSDAQKSDLNSPVLAAQELVAHWHTWGFASGASFGQVPTDLPQGAKDTLNYIEQNPALMKAIGAGDGKGSGTITKQDVVNFINKATGDAKAGASAYSDFVKSNPDASDASKTLAQSAAIVLGNQTLFSAGSTDPKRLVDGELRAGDLANIANISSMGSTLTDAARLWSQPGMFSQLDTGGQDLTTAQPDGIADSGNLKDWISKQAPSMTGASLGSLLSEAADRNIVAGVDTSKLGPDVFANPQNYSGAQKAAVIQQLSDIQAKVKAGVDSGVWAGAAQNIDWGDPTHPQVNNDPNQVEGDIAGKIAKLSSDPDVQKFLSDNRRNALQTIVGADPALQKSIQSFYDGDLQNGKALTDALNAKDGNGNKVTAEQGLESFVQTANTLSEALGTDQPTPGTASAGDPNHPKQYGLDLQAIAQKSGQQGALQQAYTDDILSGKELKDAIDNGTDIGTAVQQFTIDAANFGATLPADFVSSNAQKLQQTLSDTVSDGLINNATQADVNAAFADSNGNFDSAKLTDALNQAIKQNPDLGKDANGVTIKPDQIVSAVNALFTDVRNGVKLQDALAKLAAAQNSDNPTFKPPTGVAADVYNKGFLHLLGAAVNSGVLIAKGVEGKGDGSSKVVASDLSSGLQIAGGLLEGGSKYAKATKYAALTADELKFIEGAGKSLGGAGGIIGGALGIFSGVQSLQAGDRVGGGVSIATGITGTWSGVSSAIEGGVGAADAAGLLGDIGVDAAALAATSATLGIVGGAVTLLGTLGLGIYAAVEGLKRVDDYTGQIQPMLQQYGITGGTAPSNNPPVDNQPPVEA